MPSEPLGRRPTVRDVARAAGVSATSVSNYFRHRSRLSASTAERVRAAVDALDYRPNRAAGALRRTPAQALGFIADLRDRTNLEVFAGAEQAALERGWFVQIGDSQGSPERARDLLQLFSAGGVAAVMVSDGGRRASRDDRAAGAWAAALLLAGLAADTGDFVVLDV